MEMPFGLYPQFYVKRKSQLFPLIEKYSGEKISAGTSHGTVIPVYLRLLKTNAAFKAEVDALIEAQSSQLITLKQKVMLKQASQNDQSNITSNLHNGTAFNNASDPVTAIASAIGNIFGTIKADKEASAESDKMFYETVLNDQKNSDTTKLLIVTGVTLAFIGLGVFLVLKLKK